MCITRSGFLTWESLIMRPKCVANMSTARPVVIFYTCVFQRGKTAQGNTINDCTFRNQKTRSDLDIPSTLRCSRSFIGTVALASLGSPGCAWCRNFMAAIWRCATCFRTVEDGLAFGVRVAGCEGGAPKCLYRRAFAAASFSGPHSDGDWGEVQT